MPPPWMSNSSPSQRRAMAEHSRCQPGRPAPKGVGHDALSGSSDLWPFQSAKSRGSRLPRGSASSAPTMSSSDWPVREPYSGVERLRGEALVAVGQGEPVLAGVGGLAQHLVVDVGDVAHERDVVAVTDLEPAAQHVERDGEPDVPDVRRTLRREATDVHADLARLARREVAQLPGRGVEQS